jgi:hypothetical protein
MRLEIQTIIYRSLTCLADRVLQTLQVYMIARVFDFVLVAPGTSVNDSGRSSELLSIIISSSSLQLTNFTAASSVKVLSPFLSLSDVYLVQCISLANWPLQTARRKNDDGLGTSTVLSP